MVGQRDLLRDELLLLTCYCFCLRAQQVRTSRGTLRSHARTPRTQSNQWSKQAKKQGSQPRHDRICPAVVSLHAKLVIAYSLHGTYCTCVRGARLMDFFYIFPPVRCCMDGNALEFVQVSSILQYCVCMTTA